MMQVIFEDLQRETYLRVGGVVQFQSDWERVNGRATKVWNCVMEDQSLKVFPQKHFKVYRVEI